LSKETNNYPAMISLAKDIGAVLINRGFERNKYSYKVRGENYHSNFIRPSKNELYLDVASVAVYCKLPQDDQELYFAPMAARIDAGVELRSAIPELYRPAGARDEMKLADSDCTFRPSEHQLKTAMESMKDSTLFCTAELGALTMLPNSDDRVERIAELVRFFELTTDSFFSQFSSDFPFKNLTVSDIEELHCHKVNQYSDQFQTSAYSLAGAAESYWKQKEDFIKAEVFKKLRRKIFNDPESIICSISSSKHG
jgi:hypothetical protein